MRQRDAGARAERKSGVAPHAPLRPAHHRGRAGRQVDRHGLDLQLGDRVFHQKFGNGNVTASTATSSRSQFDKAGEKRVVDSFVERV